MKLTELLPYIYGWSALFVVVLGLAVRRAMVTRHEDETLHLAETEAALVAQQTIIGRKIREIDRWGQWLTVVAVVYGLALLAMYLYGVWVAGNKPVL
jgi:hypothetical protein